MSGSVHCFDLFEEDEQGSNYMFSASPSTLICGVVWCGESMAASLAEMHTYYADLSKRVFNTLQ